MVDSGSLGHVLERQRIEQLPINGRSIEALLVTVPGLETPKPGASAQVRSWGVMPGAYGYFLDGAVLGDAMWNEGTIIRPPGLDTIQEFKVETNASSARYSRMTSVIMSTKSGSNQFHGSAFETNRHNAYGKARSRTDFGAFPVLNRNEFGGSLGGPVILPKLYNGKDRTFFFTAYEGFRSNSPSNVNLSVPTAAMRAGDFSGLKDIQGRLLTLYDPQTTDTTTWARQPFSYGGTLNRIDPARISPLAKYIFDVSPQPTYPDRNPLLDSNWYGLMPDETRQFTLTERIDHRFTDKDQFYVRFNYARHNRFYGMAGQVLSLDKIASYINDVGYNTSGVVNWVRTFSPTMFNEVSATYAHTYRDRGTGDPDVSYIDQLGVPNPFNQKGFPYIQNIGLGGNTYLGPNNRNRQTYTYPIIEDNATKIVGRHEIQFGTHVRFDFLNTLPQQVYNTGVVSFNNPTTALYDTASNPSLPQATPFTGHNLGNLFLGHANYQANLRLGELKIRQKEYAFYLQDNFKVTPRLTLNLGLRWQLSPHFTEANGVGIAGFDRATKSIVLPMPLEEMYDRKLTVPSLIQAYRNIGVKFATYSEAGQPKYGIRSNWRDLGPRLGAAYRVGDGRSSFVIRGNYSKTHYREALAYWLDQSAANTPMTAQFNYSTLWDGAVSPDGLQYWGMRSNPTVIAGKNSADIMSLDRPVGIVPGNTWNYFFNPEWPTDYVHTWNVTLEKEVMSNTVARAGWVGTHSGNQSQSIPLNDNIPDYIWYATTGNPLPTGTYQNTARRMFDQTTYGSLVEYVKTSWSNYSGVNLEIERRYSKGVGYQLSYVIGNAMLSGGGGASWAAAAAGYNSTIAEPAQFLPGAVPADLHQRDRFLNYRRDTSVPKHRVRWNWIVDVPFGRGKAIGRNVGGFVDKFIGGWQIAGMGTLASTYGSLSTGQWEFTGEPLQQYGYKYPIEDCTSGACYPGYLWYNGYIPSNKINSVDANGKPNGIMGVPADYKPAMRPLIPWGSTALPANAPANTNVAQFWDTNTVWIPLKNATAQRVGYNTNLHPWRNQYIPGPLQWSQDASLVKRIAIREGTELRFTADAFNVFNHPNNGAGVGGNGLLSTRGQANPAREMQLSVRLSW